MLATGQARPQLWTYVAVRTSKDSLRSIRVFVVFPLPLPSLLTGGTVQTVLLVCLVSLVRLLGLHLPSSLPLLTVNGEPAL